MVRSLAIASVSLMLAASFGSVQPVSAQNVVYSSPTYTTGGSVCATCGGVQGNAASVIQNSGVTYSSPTYSSPTYSSPTYSSPTTYSSNYSGNYSPGQQTSYSSGYSSGGTSNVLAMLNSQRARQGVGALSYDPTLQAVAQRRAETMASMGMKSHPPGSFAPGRYEGVGWSSSFSPSGVSACYTSSPNMRYAGAAMARGRDGVYFAVVYR